VMLDNYSPGYDVLACEPFPSDSACSKLMSIKVKVSTSKPEIGNALSRMQKHASVDTAAHRRDLKTIAFVSFSSYHDCRRF